MSDFETVEGSVEVPNPMYQKQKEGVARMRTSLLACTGDPSSVRLTMNRITALRIYHQMTRIINYLDMMDRIEQKMYESIDRNLETMNTSSPSTWVMLLNMQERLQRNMIESHKLLQPYLELNQKYADEFFVPEDESPASTESVLSVESRDKIRQAAQTLLLELRASDASGS